MPSLENQLLDNPSEIDSKLTDEEEQAQIEQLDKLGMALSEYRSEAIDYRQASGIERDWTEDREHYEGIDDVNRGEMGSWESKPPGRGVLGGDDNPSSTVFFNITAPFCDTASARVGDMLLPVDDKGWSINPTPIPDMVEIAKGNIPYKIEQQIRSQVPEESVGEMMQMVVDQEKLVVDEAKAQAKRAEKRIEDWHIECQFNAEMRMVIEDSSQIGTGVLKGPIPENKKHMAFKGGEMIIQDELQPVSRRVQVEKCFPDPACGQDIQNGSRHFEYDDLSDRALNALKEQDGYIDSQIELCLKEGPFEAVKVLENIDEGDQRGLSRRKKSKLFQIWYIYCQLKKSDIEASGLDVADDDDNKYEEADEFTEIDIHLVMVNNRVILATLNHLDGGEFPYDYMVWQARSGVPYGIGISRQIRIPQRVINGAGRNLMDNAGMAGGPMMVFQQGLIEPANEKYEIKPRKIWFSSEDAESTTDVQNGISFITMPMEQENLQAIIKMGMNFAEYMSGLPSLLQGQEQEHEETLGGQQARRNDGSTTLRRIVRLYDDKITTPHIRRYYKWILLYGEDNEKGDFVIEARGSSALIERDIQNQSIIDLAPLASQPQYGLDPKKWMKEYLRSQKLDPKNFEFDDDEWQEIVEKMSAPPPDSSVEVAGIRAEIEQLKIQSKENLELGKMQNDNSQADQDRQLTLMIEQMEQQIDMLKIDKEHAGDKDTNMDNIKAELTKTLLTLKTQVALNGTNAAEPIVEPRGRAAPDKAFQE